MPLASLLTRKAVKLFHGSPKNFDSFDPEFAKETAFGKGFSFTPDEKIAKNYADLSPKEIKKLWGEKYVKDALARKKDGTPVLYAVEANIDDSELLLARKNFNSQNKSVQSKINKLIKEEKINKNNLDLDKPKFWRQLIKESGKSSDNLFPKYKIKAILKDATDSKLKQVGGDLEYTVFDPKSLKIVDKVFLKKEGKEMQKRESKAAGGAKRASILNKDYMEGKAKGSLVGAQKKLDLNKNNKIDKEDFSMLREKKAAGSKVITKNIIDFAEKLMAKEAPKKAAERRASIKSAAEAEDIIVNKINSDPFAMNEMPLSILENLSVKNKAKIGLADEYSADIAESTGGMLKDMSPKEAAENLLAFEDDEIFDYMSTLNARDLRQFKDNLSDDDFEAFGDYMPDLGPREKKAEGSLLGSMEGKEKEAVKAIIINKLTDMQDPNSKSRNDSLVYLQKADPSLVMSAIGQTVSPEDQRQIRTQIFGRQERQEGGSMLVPPEMPVDTYTPAEQANAAENMLPDGEMEDNYMDYVLEESLESDEQDYLMDALESDPKLSDIFDKVLMTASEFSGAGEVEGPGTGVSDSIPARLSDGEFVITKKATDQIGADNLQRMMDDAERMADGGVAREGRQFGGILGMPKNPEEELEAMSQMRSTDDEINQAMLRSNQVPSLRRY